MKRINKKLTACIISILLLVFTAFHAFAEVSADTQQAIDSYIQQIMPELTNISEETAAETIAYYNENGYPGIAEGFQTWIDLSKTAGAYQSVGSCSIVENEDGSMQLSAPVTCEKTTVYMELLLSADGYVESFKFTSGKASSEGSIGSKLREATVNLVVGMGTVFAVLIFLCWVISLFKNISKIEKKIADKKAAKANADAAPVQNRTETVSVSPAPASNDELQAVIAAAIAAYEADNGSTIEKQPALGNGITIKTYRRN